MRYMMLLFALTVGCTAHLASTTKTNLTNSAHLTERAYAYLDAGSAPAALIRAAHCSTQAVLRDEKIGTIDSGIECSP
jgi:hypothetical protein